MTRSLTKHLAMTVAIANKLEKRRALTNALEQLLESLKSSGTEVAVEVNLVKTLQKYLGEAKAIFLSLENVPETKKAIEQLSDLDSILSDSYWDAALDVIDYLNENKKQQDEQLRDYQEKLLEWESRIKSFSTKISQAQQARAAIIKERDLEKNLRVLIFEQAPRAIETKNLAELYRIFSQLDASSTKSELGHLENEISDKIEQTKQFGLQADLLLLRSPLVNKSYQYTVLLRTPSEPGTHGINIQAQSVLTEQDRDYIIKRLKIITQNVNTGIIRRHKKENSITSSSESTEPTESALFRNFNGSNLNIDRLLQDVGDFMYRVFMPDQMRDYMQTTSCSITITTNDLELPWELICHNNRFLCLDRPMARLPMGETFPRRASQLGREGKLRFLLIYSDSEQQSLKAAGEEITLIEDELKKNWESRIKDKRLEIEVLRLEDATGNKLNNALRGVDGTYDVIHYAGHAIFEKEQPELSGLLLHKEEVFCAQKFRRLLQGRPLVFLNACESARTADENRLQTVNQCLLKESAEGLAKAAIYGGAVGCIGALWPVYDVPAAEFAVNYYNKILEGCMIGEAMRQARVEIRGKYPNYITWAAFVLYGDPTYRFVEVH